MTERTERSSDIPLTNFTRAWASSSKHVSRGLGQFYRSMVKANRAFLTSANGESERSSSPSSELAYSQDNWTVERSLQVDGSVTVGDSVRFTKRFTREDVEAFAAISGDTNRLHLDPEFAQETRFGRQIVHGTLVGGLISAALARLPGLTVYLSQDLQFSKPVDIGGSLTAICEVVEELGDGRYRLTTVVEAEDGTEVIEGEAIVLIDDIPTESTSDANP